MTYKKPKELKPAFRQNWKQTYSHYY